MLKKFLLEILILANIFACSVQQNFADKTNDDIKKQLCPDAFKPAWAIETAQELFSSVGYGQTKITDIPSDVREAVLANLYIRLSNRQTEFIKIRNEKYVDCTNDISYSGIQKGDIILSVTHNPLLMAASGENDVIHGSLCIKTPQSDDDIAFVSIQSMDGVVTTFPIKDLQKNASKVFVLRFDSITNQQIDKICDYALRQLGKSYNMSFTNKWDEEKFYCTQLIWRAFYESGLQIDSNHDKNNDYGVVFARDILRCKKLKIIKFFE